MMTTSGFSTPLGMGLALTALTLVCDGPGRAAMDAARRAEPTVVAGACTILEQSHPLDDALKEISGITRSVRDTTTFWAHNDGGNPPVLYQLTADGRTHATVEVAGAANADWEDLATAPCPDGSPCLFIGDIGDNIARRKAVTIYRIPEPTPGTTRTQPADPLRAAYPRGPQDAEALFGLPSGELYLVTKGRQGPIELYRFQPPRPRETSELIFIRTLHPTPRDNDGRVTGASASPSGQWVAIRTYRTLMIYRKGELLTATGSAAITFDLSELDEKQGEAVWLADDGRVWLASEGSGGVRARLASLQCELPVK